MNLSFDPVDHVYRLDGAVIPSVTQLLSELYGGAFDRIPEAILDRKRDIGRAVHSAAELLDAEVLDDSTVDESCVGYLDAYREFLRIEQPEWVLSEVPMAHPLHRYAGTPDRIGLLRGDQCVVDFKTCVQLHAAIGVQTAAYDLLRQQEFSTPMPAKRYALQLKPNGTYKLVPYQNADDYRVFLSLIGLYNWKRKHEH